MKIINSKLISISEEDLVDGVFINKTIIEIGDRCFLEMPSLNKVFLPKVKNIGSYCFSYNASLTEISLPALTTAGSDCFSSNASLTEISLPALTTAGSDCFSSNDKLTEISLPALTTAGSDCFSSNASLTEISLGRQKLECKCVDGFPFIIESSKPTKGIKIYSGYNFISLEDKKINNKNCFVAEKDKFFAHGETVKKAISDLQFKIVAEKLKKNPIKKDTIITIQYYRLITGACEMGVKSWMDSNGIKKEKIKAIELLPLLEKTNAYGLFQFKKLITW